MEEYIEPENEIRRLELQVKELELKQKEFEENSRKKLNPIIVAIIAALLGLLGNTLVTYLEGKHELELERKRFESSLIIEMIKGVDQETAADNLNFLLDAGFIEDREGKIRKLPKEKLPISPGPIYHRVREEETLSSIAALYGVTAEAIAAANGMQAPYPVYVGQVLLIPRVLQ